MHEASTIAPPPPLQPQRSVFCRLSAAHTPDNSFLGFVVEQHLNASDIKHIDDIKRQNQSLVYGKVDNFWKVRWLQESPAAKQFQVSNFQWKLISGRMPELRSSLSPAGATFFF